MCGFRISINKKKMKQLIDFEFKSELNNITKKADQAIIITTIISIVVVIIKVWYFYGGGVERGVANDEIKQYEMCVRNNDFIGASAHAGIVSAAFQQAGDEGGYSKCYGQV